MASEATNIIDTGNTGHRTSPVRNYQTLDSDVTLPTAEGDNVTVRREAPTAGQEDTDSQLEPLDADKLLLFGAKQIISLFIPVSVCMMLVVLVACTLRFYTRTDVYLVYTPFHSDDATASTQVWESLANAMIFMCVIAVMTVVLVLLFKYECYKFIHGWLIFTTLIVLFFMCLIFFMQLVEWLSVFIDYLSASLIMWNFGVCGLVMIHWKGPLLMQQSYLIVISAQMALIFLKFLPQWTCWVLLGVLAIWDLVAVLCPRGPLRMLVEMAQERDQSLFPALIYSTTAAYMMIRHEPPTTDEPVVVPPQQTTENGEETEVNPVEHQTQLDSVAPNLPLPETVDGNGSSLGGASDSSDNSFNSRRPLNPQASTDSAPSRRQRGSRQERAAQHADPQQRLESSQRARDAVSALNGRNARPVDTATEATRRGQMLRDIQEEVLSREERGVKLGLGDFVFYSLLMGRAAVDGDATTILACYVAILLGMCLTILLLAIAGRALPALPISITFGIIFYFVTALIISPFTDSLSVNRVFI